MADDTPKDRADVFVTDLNNVADTLVLLVDKWRRAYTLTMVCVALILACIGLIVKAGFEISHLQRSQEALLEELRKTKYEVRRTGDKVDEAKDEVKRTSDKVDEAAEAAPKVKVNKETGEARVVIQVKSTPPKSSAKASPPSSQPKDALPTLDQVSAPLDPRIDIESY